jgi:hypothetical protein
MVRGRGGALHQDEPDEESKNRQRRHYREATIETAIT